MVIPIDRNAQQRATRRAAALFREEHPGRWLELLNEESGGPVISEGQGDILEELAGFKEAA